MANKHFLEQGKILVVGDVHGHVDGYWKILQKHKSPTIQLGDFGVSRQHQWHLDNIDSDMHKINFGNHDDYNFVSRPHSLGDWSYSNEIMTIRGAQSVDIAYRTRDVDWWENEQLNYYQMQQAIDLFLKIKPKIMITHDCPQIIRNNVFGIEEKSLTSNGLQQMFELHQPLLWIFGHHHKSMVCELEGTQFRCLDELETFLI